MRYTDEQLDEIIGRTDGRCHICGRMVCRNNYGNLGQRGAWEVEHSNPRSKGGGDRLSNLYAAHISCNREKGTVTSRTARRWNGRTKAPLSKEKKAQIQNRNRWGWGAAGALYGAAVGGPAGLVVGGLVGAFLGDQISPD